MATSNTTNFGSLLKELYTLPPVRVLRDKSFLHDKLTKDSAELDFSGKLVRFPVTLQRNLGRGSRGDGGILPTAGTENLQDATVFIKRHYYALEWTEAVEVATKNKAGAFENVVTMKMKNVSIDMAKEANRQHYNGATGSMATLTANTAGTAVLPVDATQYFQVGDVLDIYSAGVIVGAGTGVSVLSIQKAAKTITVSAAQTLTSANVVTFHLAGNFGNECEGLRIICDQNRTLHGINSATAGQEEWGGNVRSLANAVAGESSFELLFDDIGERQRGDMDTYLTTRGIRRRLADEFASQRRYIKEGATDIKAGYSSIEVNGKECVIDDDAPKGYVFGITMETHKILQAISPGWLETEAGDGAYIELKNHTVAGQKVAAWQSWYRYHWSHACTDPGRNGMLTNVADD